MPNYFAKLCAEDGKDVSVTYVTRGKYTFSLQSKRKQVLDALSSKKWDIIVLQGSSKDMLRDSTTLKTKTLPAIETFQNLFKRKQKQAKVYLFMTWPYQKGYAKLKRTNTPSKMTQEIAVGYKKISSRYKLEVIPVGLVWNETRKLKPSIPLYDADKAHPSVYGSYLVANCLFHGIFKSDQKEFQFTATGNKTKEELLQKAALKVRSRNLLTDLN